MDIGESFRDWLRNTGLDQKYADFHLYSHSAGSWLINGIAQGLKEPFGPIVGTVPNVILGPRVQMTMFDAFAPPARKFEAVARLWKDDTPLIRWGSSLPQLGEFADYAEHFVDRRRLTLTGIPVTNPLRGRPITISLADSIEAVPFTDEKLLYAVNFDVTNLDATLELDPRVYQQISLARLFINEIFQLEQDASLRSHAWPHVMYRGSVGVALAMRGGASVLPTNPLLEGFPRAPEFTRQTPKYAGERQRGEMIVLPQLGSANESNRPTSTFSAGPGLGSGPIVRSYNSDGTERFVITVFDPAFTGGVRVVEADLNGDGVPDLIVGTGPGASTRVRVLDGKSQAELFAIDPFEAAFTGGVYISAGDIDGDGIPDIVISPDEGGGPRVRIFSGKDFSQLADFFGIDDPNFRGGARTAIGDMNGDGRPDLVVAAGFGGGPRVAIFDGSNIGIDGGPKLIGDFLAFEDTLRNGIFVAVGDVNGDGYADLMAGGGPGGGPRVSVFDGKSLMTGEQRRDADFFAGDPENRGGIRVAVKDLDGDNQMDLVTGSGSGGGSNVTAYSGASLSTNTPTSIFSFDAFPDYAGGVFVG